MKNIFLLGVLFLGCASHHGEVFPKPPAPAALTITPNQTTYDQVVTSKTTPGDCIELSDKKYCRWEKDTLVFNKNIYLKEIAPKDSSLDYIGLVKTLGDVSQTGRNVWLTPAKKSMNPNGLEWKSHLQVLEATFSTSGMHIVQDVKDADQIIKVSFGMKQLNTENYSRSLKYTSHLKTKPENEIWSISITSQGEGHDLKKVLPALASIAKSHLTKFREENREFKVSESDINIVAFKDFTNSPQ